MKRFCLVMFTAFLAISSTIAQSITVGTFNLRYDNPGDSGNLWKNRAPYAAALIRFHEFDIVGTQEGLKHQLEDLQRDLPDFAYYGLGRDDGKEKGEHSAIFYRKSVFNVLDSGSFWLSETPDKPGWGWDARFNRICSWMKLKTRKGNKVIYVFNVHYDHQGMVARRESSKLMLQKIKQIAGKSPVILTGDFNGAHDTEWYRYLAESDLLNDAYKLARDPYANNGSFNAFRPNNPSREIIDHIFISGQFSVKRYGILTDTYHGRYPSDHHPVLVTLELK